MAGLGYEIGASLANSSAAGSNPFEEDGTVFIFGNADNPSLTGEQTPDTTSTATATTALPGGTATSNVGTSGPNAPGVGTSTTTSGGSNLEIYLFLAGAALLLWSHFHKK